MTLSHREIMDLWAKYGGAVHGPRFETVTIPQSKFWAFVGDVWDHGREEALDEAAQDAAGVDL